MHLHLTCDDSPYHSGDVSYGEHLENARRCAATLRGLFENVYGFGVLENPDEADQTAHDVRHALDWIQAL